MVLRSTIKERYKINKSKHVQISAAAENFQMQNISFAVVVVLHVLNC